jgi:REP element-mobilizing transposase RayT
VNAVKSYSARRVNTVIGRGGRVWQRGFHDHAVRKDESLEDIARYVVLNPVRAGLVGSVGAYPLWDAIWV